MDGPLRLTEKGLEQRQEAGQKVFASSGFLVDGRQVAEIPRVVKLRSHLLNDRGSQAISREVCPNPEVERRFAAQEEVRDIRRSASPLRVAEQICSGAESGRRRRVSGIIRDVVEEIEMSVRGGQRTDGFQAMP